MSLRGDIVAGDEPGASTLAGASPAGQRTIQIAAFFIRAPDRNYNRLYAALLPPLTMKFWHVVYELATDQVCFPDSAVMHRIVAREDLVYIAGLHSPRLYRLLIRERRRLALNWLHASRDAAYQLLQRHARAVRRPNGIHIITEARVACFLALAMLVSITLAGLVRSGGAFRARTLFHRLIESSDFARRLAATKV